MTSPFSFWQSVPWEQELAAIEKILLESVEHVGVSYETMDVDIVFRGKTEYVHTILATKSSTEEKAVASSDGPIYPMVLWHGYGQVNATVSVYLCGVVMVEVDRSRSLHERARPRGGATFPGSAAATPVPCMRSTGWAWASPPALHGLLGTVRRKPRTSLSSPWNFGARGR
jgi:hypothetical protein